MPYCKKNNNLLDVDSINNPNQDCFAQDSAVGGGGKASYSQNKASSLARIRAIHVDGKKDLIPVCASCHYPDQAATTSLQDHIPKLKTIYLYPYQLIQFNQKPKDTTAIDIAHKESHESN